jgi:hypothetical protein
LNFGGQTQQPVGGLTLQAPKPPVQPVKTEVNLFEDLFANDAPKPQPVQQKQ